MNEMMDWTGVMKSLDDVTNQFKGVHASGTLINRTQEVWGVKEIKFSSFFSPVYYSEGNFFCQASQRVSLAKSMHLLLFVSIACEP